MYLWRCQDGRPVIVRALDRPDARGFLASIWYRILLDGGSAPDDD